LAYNPRKDVPLKQRQQQLERDVRSGNINRPLQKWERQYIKKHKLKRIKGSRVPRWKRDIDRMPSVDGTGVKGKPDIKEYTPGQIVALSKIRQVTSAVQYARMCGSVC